LINDDVVWIQISKIDACGISLAACCAGLCNLLIGPVLAVIAKQVIVRRTRFVRVDIAEEKCLVYTFLISATAEWPSFESRSPNYSRPVKRAAVTMKSEILVVHYNKIVTYRTGLTRQIRQRATADLNL